MDQGEAARTEDKQRTQPEGSNREGPRPQAARRARQQEPQAVCSVARASALLAPHRTEEALPRPALQGRRKAGTPRAVRRRQAKAAQAAQAPQEARQVRADQAEALWPAVQIPSETLFATGASRCCAVAKLPIATLTRPAST